MNTINANKIKITCHARLRLSERVDLNLRCGRKWDTYVKDARYKGIDIDHFCGDFYTYLQRNFYKGTKTTCIKVFRNNVYVFKGNKGKAKTLITVMNVSPEFENNYISYIRREYLGLYKREVEYFANKSDGIRKPDTKKRNASRSTYS